MQRKTMLTKPSIPTVPPLSTEYPLWSFCLKASTDVNVTDANDNKPDDLIAQGIKLSKRRSFEMLLKGLAIEDGSGEEEIEEK